MTFRRLTRTLATVLPLVETLFDISTKAKALFASPDQPAEDDEWEDVATEEVGPDHLQIEIAGEASRKGDRLVLQRRRTK